MNGLELVILNNICNTLYCKLSKKQETVMARGTTTSIRLDPDLRDQLEHASQVMHRGKNWIINHALQQYLSEVETVELAKEAQRQSLLARRSDEKQEEDWEDLGDTSGWH